MRHTAIVLITLLLSAFSTASAQDKLPADLQRAANACIKMRNALSKNGSTATMRDGLNDFLALDIKPFTPLRRQDESPSLDGHFVFDKDFVKDMVDNRGVYDFAQRYVDRSGASRGSSSASAIMLANSVVGPKATARFSLAARGKQYIAVVTEPGGLVTLRVHDTTNDTWYRDTRDERKGRPYRALAMDLPEGKRCKLEIEVINTTSTPVSFAILGN